MNVKETIFALSLASNFEPLQHFRFAYGAIAELGETKFSSVFLIPCRDGVGQDYWNSACLLKSALLNSELEVILKQFEQRSGRRRPSHQISLDIDIIAYGKHLEAMQFNPKKKPLAIDVKIPLYQIWPNPELLVSQHAFPQIMGMKEFDLKV